MTGRICLRSDGATAEISPLGAELLAWSVAGRPLLWEPDPAVWADTAPILFPVVGWTRNGQVRVGDSFYPLGLHGFARTGRFEVASLGDDCVCLVLRSNAETRRLYPFDFRFAVSYRLAPVGLAIGLTVSNLGVTAMPYACGLHPGFRWPLGGGDPSLHRILFDAAESPFVPEIAPGGLFSTRQRQVPLDGSALPLSHDLLAQEALCFLDVESRGLTYEAPDGAALRVEMDGFAHVALWARPPAPFLSIELWTGHGDPDGFDGTLAEKPSMRLLAPGAEACHEARFTFTRAAS